MDRLKAWLRRRWFLFRLRVAKKQRANLDKCLRSDSIIYRMGSGYFAVRKKLSFDYALMREGRRGFLLYAAPQRFPTLHAVSRYINALKIEAGEDLKRGQPIVIKGDGKAYGAN
jgi:hypothetical protein